MRKTATIQIYPLFQANGWGTMLSYRGQVLKSEVCADKIEAMRIIESSARIRGFTHAKIYEQSPREKIKFYTVKL